MSHRSSIKSEVILDDVSSEQTSQELLVTDFRHVVFSVGTSGSADLDVKFRGAITDPQADTTTDLTSAASQTNQWDYVQVINLNDQGTDNGDTGIVYSGTDAVELVEVNTNLLSRLVVEVTNYTTGSVTVIGKATGN